MKVSIQKVRKCLVELLEKLGISENDSKTIIECYLEADLCGVNTHGINILPAHIKKITENKYNISPKFEISKGNNCYSVYDGQNSIGPVSANFGMKLAIEKAKEFGIHTVFSYNNNTMGPLFYYNSLALDENMIGITICNSPPAMAPINGKDKKIGTNPMAISVPANKEKPIILDLATSSVAKSRIKQFLLEGKSIPLGWATDSNGEDTSNPKEALNGLVLPMAGYKGYGIAMMIDILSGVLSGAGYLDKVNRFYDDTNKCMNVGFTFIAINPKIIYGDDFYNAIDEYIKEIKESTPKGKNIIRLPGEDRIENRNININIKQGIELNDEVIFKLKEYCKELNIECDWS